MLSITFQNERGIVRMGGGNSPYWKITEIEGLGLLAPDRKTTSYIGIPGEELSYSTYGKRTITMSVYVPNRGRIYHNTKAAIRVFAVPGELAIAYKGDKKKISAVCTAFSPGEKDRERQKYSVQFTCDFPFFTDLSPASISVYQKENHIKDTFSLPMVFSSRVSRGIVENRGDIQTDPVFLLTQGTARGKADGNVRIINHTTQKEITLIRGVQDGEILTVDIKNRQITSSLSSNQPIYILSEDSRLGEMYLLPGENDIEVLNDSGADMACLCQFDQLYMEAVVC